MTVGIGCDPISAVDIANDIAATGKQVEVLTIEAEGE